MSHYKITNPALNTKRVFILQKSEEEKMLDPSWYIYLQSIQGFKHKNIALKSLLLEKANIIEIDKVPVFFIDYDSLIIAKKATNRLKDQLDIEELEKLNRDCQ